MTLAIALAMAGQALAAIPPAAERYRAALLSTAEDVFGRDAPTATWAAQIAQESTWREDALSIRGAQGIAQFMPATARAMATAYPELRPPQPWDPIWSLRAHALLTRENDRRYRPGRSECSAGLFGLAAYNGGPTALDREINLCRAAGTACDPYRWFFHVDGHRSRSLAAFAENRDYVLRVYQRSAEYVAAGWGRALCRP